MANTNLTVTTAPGSMTGTNIASSPVLTPQATILFLGFAQAPQGAAQLLSGIRATAASTSTMLWPVRR